jgi:hypothetical protein
MASSLSRIVPYIDQLALASSTPNALLLRNPDALNNSRDLRDDPRVRATLERLGLLHGGLSVELRAARIAAKDSSGCVVEARITLRNQDSDSLYVLDPQTMGDAATYYMRGLELRHGSSCPTAIRDAKSGRVPECRTEWLTLLAPGQVIERAVTRRFADLQQGDCNCRYAYSVSGLGCLSTLASPSGAPIWLGEIWSDWLALPRWP